MSVSALEDPGTRAAGERMQWSRPVVRDGGIAIYSRIGNNHCVIPPSTYKLSDGRPG